MGQIPRSTARISCQFQNLNEHFPEEITNCVIHLCLNRLIFELEKVAINDISPLKAASRDAVTKFSLRATFLLQIVLLYLQPV